MWTTCLRQVASLPRLTVSVLSSVAANATNDNVRLDALRMMPQLLEQKNYQQQLKSLLVRRISSLTEVDVLRRQLMLDIQTLVEADESYRKLLIAKTANHNLKALKMLFKSARRDGVVTEDPTEFLETVRRERVPKIKRPFTAPELRGVLVS
jgi:hypothetical protein